MLEKLIKLSKKRYVFIGSLLLLSVITLLTPSPSQAQVANLVTNPGCETNTTGWTTWQASIARTTAVYRSGVASCEVTRTSGTSYTMDDNPATLASPSAGATYIGRAWVRTSNAVGKTAQVYLRQSGGPSSTRTTAGTAITLSTSWQEASVSAVMDAGRTNLEIYIAQNSAVSGNKIQIDDISLKFDCLTPPPADTMNTKSYPCPLFSTSSAWNATASGQVASESSNMVTSTMSGSLKYAFTQQGRGFDIAGTDDYPDYGVPMYYADNNTPRVDVSDSRGWWGGFTNVPIPSQAQPAVGTDMHLTIWDVPNNTLYEYWEMQQDGNGDWSAGFASTFASNGLGYNTSAWTNGARAYGGSLIAGSIRYQEMVDGEIKHALAMAYPWTLGKKYAMGLGADGINYNIATHSDNSTASNRNTIYNLPEGSRIRLKASVDVDATCGSNRACKIIGNAMQDYGIYLVDTGGVASIYAEVLTGKDVSWDGLLSLTDAHAFTADDFELLSLPTTLTQAP